MANIGEWIVNVIAEFDPDKIVKKMDKTGKKSGEKFAKSFSKIAVSTIGNSLAQGVTHLISNAWNSTGKEIKKMQDKYNQFGDKNQSVYQTSQETGVDSGILEALGSMSTAQGGSQGDVNSVFQQIKDARMRGESKVGGKDTLEVFNNMLDRVFAEQDLERRSMLIKDFGLEGMSNILYNGNKDSFRQKLAQSNLKGRVNEKNGAIESRNKTTGKRAEQYQDQNREKLKSEQKNENIVSSASSGIKDSMNFDNNIETRTLENTLKNFDELLKAYKVQVEIETEVNNLSKSFMSTIIGWFATSHKDSFAGSDPGDILFAGREPRKKIK